MMVVILTAFAWYLGDALYNDYAEYVQIQGPESLTAAWWEVLIFFLSFGMLVPVVNRKINGDLESKSMIFQMMKNLTIETDQFQNQVSLIVKLLIGPWLVLMTLALIRTFFVFSIFLFPFYLSIPTELIIILNIIKIS